MPEMVVRRPEVLLHELCLSGSKPQKVLLDIHLRLPWYRRPLFRKNQVTKT